MRCELYLGMGVGGQDVGHDFPHPGSQSVGSPFCRAELLLQRAPPQVQISIETREAIRKQRVEIEAEAAA